ncbi:UDP-glucose 4-epimerase GalE [Oceanicella sp. SM1341]|uniref:UDP-glucose 4-epimerase GalE n=1 Tax=Oceanicella sp. SM1341 TaxID=1548889 RepID=UPI000E501958|nr:UDP-glucose 4-epimerase GalE [Oceanicella sp. SM1341]
MAKVLVTGGAGYIGSHACKALHRAGHTPITYDSLVTGWRDAVKFGPLEIGDLNDRGRLDEVFAEHKPDAVMHFGALSSVGEATSHPGRYWHNNVMGSMNLLDAMLAAGVDKIVFSSTCATYGEQDGVVLTEESQQMPLNSYGASKRAVEDMLRDYEMAHGLKSVRFRYFNVAGADPESEIGEFHNPETHLIPLVIFAALGRRAALTVHGDDYPTRDGTCIRDYVHVMDLVDAHLRGMDWLLAGKESEVFNLGTGSGYSVREVIEAAEKVLEREVPANTGPRRIGDAVTLVSGSVKAGEMLGWSPDRSTLEHMIRDAYGWHQRNGYES